MQTHEATIIYPRPLPDGTDRLCLDLFPAIPMSCGAAHDSFLRHFELAETHEVAGLRTLRRVATLEQFLAFFGTSWNEALGRWPELSWMVEYRREHGADTYSSVEAWQKFYMLLNDGIAPSQVALALIEHY